MYTFPCEALRGSKVKVAVAVALSADISMAISPPEVTGSPSAIHMAVGMLVRPDMTSVILQIRVNSDPATGLPDRVTLAERGFGGTAYAQ